MIKNECSFTAEEKGRTLTVVVSGEIDHHGATALRRGIDTLIWEKAPQELRLVMAQVPLMDSSGLGFIMGRFRLITESGGSFVLVDPSAAVVKMLRLTGFDKKVRTERSTAALKN